MAQANAPAADLSVADLKMLNDQSQVRLLSKFIAL
jgi:hypothetical protein